MFGTHDLQRRDRPHQGDAIGRHRMLMLPGLAPWLVFGAVLLVAAAGIGWNFDTYHAGLSFSLFAENGPVELPQSLVLVLAAGIFLARYTRSKDSVSALCAIVAYVLFHALLRETPRCNSSFYEGGMCVASNWVKAGAIAVATLVLVVLLHWRREVLVQILQPRTVLVFWPLGISAILLVLSQIFEADVGEPAGVEECLELASYVYATVFGAWVLLEHFAARRNRPASHKDG